MKQLSITLLAALILLLAACRGGENKADKEAKPGSETDTIANNDRPATERIPDAGTAEPPAAKKEDSLVNTPGNNEILAKIDRYLVSTPNYKKNGTTINTVTVTVKNTLQHVTFQKAIVEVDFLDEQGKAVRNDFYPIQNLEPGDLETIKIPDMANVSGMTCRVVKVKSNTLTNGEMVLVGNQPPAVQ